jgi:hypothetical protein
MRARIERSKARSEDQESCVAEGQMFEDLRQGSKASHACSIAMIMG